MAVEVLARLELGGAAAPEGARESGQIGEIGAHLDATIDRFHATTARPQAHAGLLAAARWLGKDAIHVTLRGPGLEDPGVRAFAAAVSRWRRAHAAPVAVAFAQGAASRPAEALVCRGQVCALPVTEASALLESLSEPSTAG